MRANQIKGIVHDIIELMDYVNPMLNLPPRFFNKKTNAKIDLLTGKIIPSGREEDSITDLLKAKRNWFVDFVKKSKGKLRDFDKANISIVGKKEKVEIGYKEKKYTKEKIW